MPPPSVEEAGQPRWLNPEPSLSFVHSNGQLWVRIKVRYPNLHLDAPTLPFACGIWNAARLLRVWGDIDTDPRASPRALELGDIYLLSEFLSNRPYFFEPDDPPKPLSDTQTRHIHQLLTRYLGLLLQPPVALSRPATLFTSITIRLLIDLFQLPYIFFQTQFEMAEILAVTDGLTVTDIMTGCLTAGHTFLFHDNHVRLMDAQSVHSYLMFHYRNDPITQRPVRTIEQAQLDLSTPIGTLTDTGLETPTHSPTGNSGPVSNSSPDTTPARVVNLISERREEDRPAQHHYRTRSSVRSMSMRSPPVEPSQSPPEPDSYLHLNDWQIQMQLVKRKGRPHRPPQPYSDESTFDLANRWYALTDTRYQASIHLNVNSYTNTPADSACGINLLLQLVDLKNNSLSPHSTYGLRGTPEVHSRTLRLIAQLIGLLSGALPRTASRAEAERAISKLRVYQRCFRRAGWTTSCTVPMRHWLSASEIHLCISMLALDTLMWQADDYQPTGWGNLIFPNDIWDPETLISTLSVSPALVICTNDHYSLLPLQSGSIPIPRTSIRQMCVNQLVHFLDHQWTRASAPYGRPHLHVARPVDPNIFNVLDDEPTSVPDHLETTTVEANYSLDTVNPTVSTPTTASVLPVAPPIQVGEGPCMAAIWNVEAVSLSERRNRKSIRKLLRDQAAARETRNQLRPFLPADHPDVHTIYSHHQQNAPDVVLNNIKSVVANTNIPVGRPLIAGLGTVVQNKPRRTKRKLLPLGNGEYFVFSSALYDVGLTSIAAWSSSTTPSRKPHNLSLYLKYSHASDANCMWRTDDSLQPILWPLRNIRDGEEICVLAPDTFPKSHTLHIEPQAEPAHIGGRHTVPGLPKPDVSSLKRKASFSKTTHRRLNHIKDGANLFLMTSNANGKARSLDYMDVLVSYFKGPRKPHGIICTDTGIRREEATLHKKELEDRLAGMGVIVRVLPAKPPIWLEDDRPTHAQLVGGSTLIFVPRPNIKLRSVHYDPGEFGTITKATLTIGKSYTITWIGAYIPCNGPGPSSLSTKYAEWFQCYRKPTLSPSALQTEGAPFDAAKWTWMLISDHILSGYYNPLHIGSILQLDANQTYNPLDHGAHSLFSRTSEIGLCSSSVQFLDSFGVPSYNTWRPLASNGTHIDFSFSSFDASWWRAAGSPDDERWAYVTDHLPVFGGWYIPHIMAQRRHKVQPSRATVKFDLSTDEKRTQVKADMEIEYDKLRQGLTFNATPAPGQEAGNTLECLCRRIVESSRTIANSGGASFRSRNRVRSDAAAGTRHHLRHLIKLHRALWQHESPQDWEKRPFPHHTKKRLSKVLKAWEQAETSLLSKTECHEYIDGGTGRPRSWWQSHLTPYHLTVTLPLTLSEVTAAEKRYLRIDERATIALAVKWRDQQVADGKLKSAIRSLLDRNSKGGDVQEVMTPDGPNSDPEFVHKNLTEGWLKMFTTNPNTLPALLNLDPVSHEDDILPAAEKWEALLDDQQLLAQEFGKGPGANIPLSIREMIAKAFCSVPGKALFELDVAAALSKPFSRPELEKVLKNTRNTAPGLTVLTYQMLQVLPSQGIDDVFRLMHRLWEQKSVAPFWQYKGLAGIPKAGRAFISGPADLRPIGLIEVTRKLWTRMVLGRIYGCLRSHPDLLQPNHCGGLADKGTDSALLQMMQMLEDYVEYDIDPVDPADQHMLDFTSWDTAKAFDSVGFHLQYVAWRRIGIPIDIVLWMMRLDIGGKFVVLTPHAQTKLDHIRMPNATSIDHHLLISSLGFTPLKGFTQGDVKSPLSWITFFDILMHSLNQCRPADYPHVRTDHSRVDPIRPIAYIDDLCSFTSSREHTEALALVVSAAHMILGTEAAVGKFRAVTTRSPPGYLTLRTGQWRERQIEFGKDTQLVRMLGTDLGLCNTWDTQIKEVVHSIRGFIKLLRRKRAAPETKRAVIVAAIFAKYMYPAAVSAWPWSGIRNISNTLSYLLREAYQLPSDFPYRLLHSQVGGLGIPRFATVALMNRERAAIRCLHGPGPARHAARGLLNRCFRHGSEDSGLSWGPITASGYDPSTYAGAIMLEGQRRGYTFHRSGDTNSHLHVSDRYDALSPSLQYACNKLDVQYLEELFQNTTTELQPWTLKFPNLFTASVRRELRRFMETLRMDAPLPITRGHVLALKPPPNYIPMFFSVDGHIGDTDILAGTWYTVAPDEQDYFIPTLIPTATTKHGCIHSGRCTLEWYQRYGYGLAFGMLFRDEDGVPSYGLMGINEAIPSLPSIRRPPRAHELPLPKWATNLAAAIHASGSHIDILTSDGSSLRHISDMSELWSNPAESHRGRGAIILSQSSYPTGHTLLEVVRVLDLAPEIAGRSDLIEIITHVASLQLAVALYHLSPRPFLVESDCDSIFKRAQKEFKRHSSRSLATKPLAALYHIIHHIKARFPQITTRWIKSHPERYIPHTCWSAANCRIAAADAYADQGPLLNIPTKLSKYPGTPHEIIVPNVPMQVSGKEVILGFFPEGEFYWTDRHGNITIDSFFRDPLADLQPYLDQREATSVSKQPWADTQVGLLPSLWKKSIIPNRKVKKWFTCHLWDKLPNFRNLAKWSPEVPLLCPLCQSAPESQSHLSLLCSHPAVTLLRLIYQREVKTIWQKIPNTLISSHLKTWLSHALHPSTESESQFAIGLLLCRPFKSSLEHIPASGVLSTACQQIYTNSLTQLWTSTMRYLELLWQLRNSLHGAPDWVRDKLQSECDYDSLLDLLKYPYINGPTHSIARLTWKQPTRLPSYGRALTLAEAARNTRPIGSYLPPIAQIPASECANVSLSTDISTSSSHHSEDSFPICESPTLSSVDSSSDDDIDSVHLDQTELPSIDPLPTNVQVRRNPSRHARPAITSEELYNFPLLGKAEQIPGGIPTKTAEKLIKHGGPPIVLHNDEHPHQWIRPSPSCPNGGYGLIFRIDPPGKARGALINIYLGTSNDDLQLTHEEAEELWKDSDYVLSSAKDKYVVNGDLSAGAARMNEGFDITNCFLYYNPKYRRFEGRLNGYAAPGYYEGLVNYTERGLPSSYWTAHRVGLLPKATRRKCLSFYPTIARSSQRKRLKRTVGEQLQDNNAPQPTQQDLIFPSIHASPSVAQTALPVLSSTSPEQNSSEFPNSG